MFTPSNRHPKRRPWLLAIAVAGALTIASAVADQTAAMRDAMATATSPDPMTYSAQNEGRP